MVGIAAREFLDVQGTFGLADKAQPKFLHQLCVEIPHLLGGDGQVKAQEAPAGEVHCREDQGLVHGKQGIPIAADAPLVSQGLGEGSAQGDADVLGGVVVIHLGVPLTGYGQVESSVAGKQGEHMVQEAAAGIDFAFPGAVQVQPEGDLGLRGVSDDFGCSHIFPPN